MKDGQNQTVYMNLRGKVCFFSVERFRVNETQLLIAVVYILHRWDYRPCHIRELYKIMSVLPPVRHHPPLVELTFIPPIHTPPLKPHTPSTHPNLLHPSFHLGKTNFYLFSSGVYSPTLKS